MWGSSAVDVDFDFPRDSPAASASRLPSLRAVRWATQANSFVSSFARVVKSPVTSPQGCVDHLLPLLELPVEGLLSLFGRPVYPLQGCLDPLFALLGLPVTLLQERAKDPPVPDKPGVHEACHERGKNNQDDETRHFDCCPFRHCVYVTASSHQPPP